MMQSSNFTINFITYKLYGIKIWGFPLFCVLWLERMHGQNREEIIASFKSREDWENFVSTWAWSVKPYTRKNNRKISQLYVSLYRAKQKCLILQISCRLEIFPKIQSLFIINNMRKNKPIKSSFKLKISAHSV